MNMLLVDAGNTRIKSRLVLPEASVELDPVVHNQDSDYGTGRLVQMLADKGLVEEVHTVHVASVLNDEQLAGLVGSFQSGLSVPVRAYHSEKEAFGVSNCYEEPHKLGVDRWLAIVAAFSAYDGAVCVIDCGSAVTVDVVDSGGAHLGGLIVPGQQMMMNSLLSGTGRINVSEAEKVGNVSMLLGKNTTQAVTQGALYANLSLIRQCMVDIRNQLQDTCTIVLTGGDSASLLPYLDAQVEQVEGLVLDGLQIYAKEHVKVSD